MFHPLVEQWFRDTFGAPSEPQRLGWPAIERGGHTLILAPTGTGKTLAAFLFELDRLIREGVTAPLANAVHLLYVSPLKALNNDIQRNLERPLAELKGRFAHAGVTFPEIRVAVRTGDTPQSARARMLRTTPHILITTPESLHILLTSVRGRGMFSALRAVIVDEIHAVAGTKRGAHLALTLERLEARCAPPPQRIGLSATQRPLEEIARFLGGCEESPPHREAPPNASGKVSGDDAPRLRFRHVTTVDCGMVKRMEVQVTSPVVDLAEVGGTVWPAVAAVALRHIKEARTTLVFVNNRATAERMAARINALADEELALPYHGSLSRERRLALEGALKAGALRALVATSSLELGIDIGSVDLVLQLQSPKRVASALQRVGRAGHSLKAVSRGVFIPTFRDDALETTAIVDAMREGDIESTTVVQNALDVLAQVIVATVSVDDWTASELLALVRRSYPYHLLTASAFEEVLAMLSGKYATELAAELEPRITWDRVTGRLAGSRASRMVAVISGGTIPDRGLYLVNLPDRTRLGELDEEFVHESRVGDVFQLGSSTWRIASIEHDRVIVTPAPGAPARMPFWHGEYAARSFELSRRVGALRRELARAGSSDEATTDVASRHHCDLSIARTLADYMAAQRGATGVVPDDRTLVVEHFRDETGAVRIVVHSTFGARVNAPWGMALAQRVREAFGGASIGGAPISVQVQTTDDGIMLRLPELRGDPPLHAILELTPAEAERRIVDEVGSTPLFGARFRMNAARALLLPRGTPRRRMPLWLQRLKALDLLQTVREHPSFPILIETYRDVMQDAFDLPALREVLGAIAEGRIGIHIAATAMPSPMTASLQFGFTMEWLYGDDTPRAEQRAAALSLDRGLLDEVMGGEGLGLDDDTKRELERLVSERRGTAAGRQARSADELALLLDRAGDLTMAELRARVAPEHTAADEDLADSLLASGRSIGLDIAGEVRVILTEMYPLYAAAFGLEAVGRVRRGRRLEPVDSAEVVPDRLRRPALTEHAARREILARLIALTGPITPREAQARYGWPEGWIELRFGEWERKGRLVRGTFRRELQQTEWCSRRLLEHARRRALALLRREIEPVELSAFAAFLQRWQHLDPRDRASGPGATASVLSQLHGIARPVDAWERDILPGRITAYDASELTRLAASGEIVWAAEGGYDPLSGARTLSRLRFLERGTGARWLGEVGDEPLSAGAIRVRDALARHGASFFADLQAATELGDFALRDALRELVAAGIATNDTMEALREAVRWRALPPRPGGELPDPTRWLPADFMPSPARRVVQRRTNLRRLPRWRRPDTEGAPAGWVGRWSLLTAPSIMGAAEPEEARAEAIARQWLERYGIVARNWWRRERPAVSWRAIYRELKRLEYRGEVRRGYFVKGLAGAQFGHPDAVERLRDADRARQPAERRMVAPLEPLVIMAASDPANPYTLQLDTVEVEPIARPRGSGALLVTRAGRVLMAAEGRGRRVRVGPGLDGVDVTEAARALVSHLSGRVNRRGRPRDLVIETIDGAPAVSTSHLQAFLDAGFRRATTELRYLR